MRAAAEPRVFNVKNNCPFTVWPATLGTPPLPQSGFELQAGAATSLEAPPHFSGRIWGRSFCSTDSSGRFSCLSGDCGSGEVACKGAGGVPPATLVELTLDGDGGKDFYDVSNVDGFNIPVAVAPQGGSGQCGAPSCPVDVNSRCPQQLQAVQGGQVVGCKSACLAFNTDRDCCRGQFGTPDTCPPTDYSKVFKDACPQAYSYAYDDRTSTFTCSGPASYLVTFCP
ncbi:hypothetical protein Taro_048601 [Colocasia esculenta]|uniref:Thaumatin-like protein 1 n=1 Tax=Colocasia esculenta TaxID=4460 RepID=A0A843X8L0_COLES|nr:hypothetical protein [Colocasia esculenta]